MITSSIEKAQVRVEGHHFDARKHSCLSTTTFLNKHREIIYARRREVLEAFANEPEKLRDRVLDIIEGEIEQVVLFHSPKIPTLPEGELGGRIWLGCERDYRVGRHDRGTHE